MADIVLVHGSFQGGWIWSKVAAGLRAAGHLVHHPSLDGCADRANALRVDITLATHGLDISRLIFFEDLRDVVLVGTSTGGMVVAQTAELIPERIGRLIFIDALVPIPGETVGTINGRASHLDSTEMTYGPPISEGRTRGFMTIEPPKLREFAQERYTPHPRGAIEDPEDLRKFWSLKWKANILRCLRSTKPNEGHQRRTAQRLGATYDCIDAGHYPMLTNSSEIVSYLLKHLE